jgi:hypothetical protein
MRRLNLDSHEMHVRVFSVLQAAAFLLASSPSALAYDDRLMPLVGFPMSEDMPGDTRPARDQSD